jgi:hypothetical protein
MLNVMIIIQNSIITTLDMESGPKIRSWDKPNELKLIDPNLERKGTKTDIIPIVIELITKIMKVFLF